VATIKWLFGPRGILRYFGLGEFCSLYCSIKGRKILGLKGEGAGDKIVLADVKRFNPSYWYVTLLCVTFYSAIFPFTALSTDFFNTKWGYSDDRRF